MMHVESKVDWIKAGYKLVVEGTAPVVRLKKPWQNPASAEMRLPWAEVTHWTSRIVSNGGP